MINYLLDQLRLQKEKKTIPDSGKDEYEIAAKMIFDLFSRKSTAALIENKYGIEGQIFSRYIMAYGIVFNMDICVYWFYISFFAEGILFNFFDNAYSVIYLGVFSSGNDILY
jgi:hypothetical protein